MIKFLSLSLVMYIFLLYAFFRKYYINGNIGNADWAWEICRLKTLSKRLLLWHTRWWWIWWLLFYQKNINIYINYYTINFFQIFIEKSSKNSECAQRHTMQRLLDPRPAVASGFQPSHHEPTGLQLRGENIFKILWHLIHF